ncbi:MAG: methyl-accepting chemotaxis protein [Pseudomonadota bacterium]
MRSLRDASIRWRLLLFSCLFSAAIILLGAMGIYSGQRALGSMEQIYASDARAIELLAEIRSNMLEAVVTSGIMLNAQQEQKAALLTTAEGYMRHAADSWTAYKKIPASPHIAALSARFEQAFSPAFAETVKHYRAGHAGDTAALAEVEAKIDPVWNAYVAATQELVKANKEQAQGRYQASVDFLGWQTLVAAMSITGGIALALYVHRDFVRTLVLPLEAAVGNCERIAAGDLRAALPPVRGKNEIGRLISAFATMQRDLSRAVSVVKHGTQEIKAATREIADGTLDLSHRTERQAASLEATSANVHALADTVRQNAGSAAQALDMIRQAGEVAHEGRAAVAKVIGTMGQIEGSANRVAEIVTVIEGIAFQTNILALNAAVEAARAGEHGRGFSVVAGEVRVLAQRCASAARDIGQLIRQSGTEVQAGCILANDAGRTMQRMLDALAGVSALAGHIADASRRQTRDIAQLNQAVLDIDGTTQQNAALVEQVSAAAGSLAGQSDALSEAMSLFKLQAQAPGAISPPRRQGLALFQ